MKDILEFLSNLSPGGAIVLLVALIIITSGAVEIVRALARKR